MPIDALPDGIDSLRARLAALSLAHEAALTENRRLSEENDRLWHLLKTLQRAQFGRHSERLDPDQLPLALEDIKALPGEQEAQAGQAEPEASAPGQGRKRQINRGALPLHLPRVHVTLAPESAACPCCGGTMHVIGEDKADRLDVIPAQYQVIVTHRPKYGCRTCESAVLQVPAPERLIRNGIPTEALVAAVIVDKYAWHLPLYRQAQIMALQGVPVDRSTLAGWVGGAAAEAKPVYLRMKEILLTSTKIAVDETRVPVLDPGRVRTKTGYFWAIARDDRPWGGVEPPAVVYTYAPGRGGKHAKALLADYRGIVQCDGYAAYKQLADAGGAVTLAFCWSHLRRRFYDLAKSGDAPIAQETLQRIAALYTIEGHIRGRSAEERRAVRQAESKPLVTALKAWFEAKLGEVSEKSTIAEAIRYGLNHWDGLARFLEDGRIELDTNSVERSIRPIALNRKNSLFAGHDGGAANWACLASLIESCKLIGTDPQAYLTDILEKLVNGWPMREIDDLLPWAWAERQGAGKLAA